MKIIKIELKKPFDNRKQTGTILCRERLSENDCQVKYKYQGIKYPIYEAIVSSVMKCFVSPTVIDEFFHSSKRIKVTNLLNPLEAERKRRMNVVQGMHIEVGRDLNPYMCYPNLHEENLLDGAKLWLAHQIVFSMYKLDIGYLQEYVMHSTSDIEDWLQNNKFAVKLDEEKKNYYRESQTFCKQIRNTYHNGRITGTEFSEKHLVDCVFKTCGFEVNVRF